LTTTVSVPRAGHDVGYFNAGHGAASCAGAMAYYARSGEPPGQWAGRGTQRLGLTGQVDPDVIDKLYMTNIAPTGEALAEPPRQEDGSQDVAVARAVRAYRRAHRYASSVELDQVRARERAKARKTLARGPGAGTRRRPDGDLPSVQSAPVGKMAKTGLGLPATAGRCNDRLPRTNAPTHQCGGLSSRRSLARPARSFER
jgi:hypothetical protein